MAIETTSFPPREANAAFPPPSCGEAGEFEPSGKTSGWTQPRALLPPPEAYRASPARCSHPEGGEEKADAIVRIARSWIGTPYMHQASLRGAGCDCLGLLRGVWRELNGEEPEDVPPYTADWAEAHGETLRDALARHLSPVDLVSVRPGDVVLFRMAARGAAKHCAIVAEQDGVRTLIHARQDARVREERFSGPWQRKLAYAFRI
ncbi:MAG: hypothetical protein KGJ78_07725 [Alphaproteobacteria bacterium]|nr:hypothetical protein [Alphaproteobacteria bacterium]